MKYKKGTRRSPLEYERDIVQYWKKHRTFEKSVEQRSEEDGYVFYDGPPFITGVPHHGTLLSSIVKDAVPRYYTMKGKHVERVWGWDTHGLPAENFVEKKLGITDRHDIGTRISLAEYITTARESMTQTGSLWEATIDRIGRWVDFKGAYKTMDKEYMESVWWAFKTLYEKGKIYEGERVLMYDTKWATPLSKAEVTMDAGAYQLVTDPSVYVKFRILQQLINTPLNGAYLLAWTTTPWTLPGNVAVAVNISLAYSVVQLGDGTKLVLAENLLEKVLTDEKHKAIEYEVLATISGEELVALEYEPLFENEVTVKEYPGTDSSNVFKVWAADYVSDESGTGIVHLAPAYGEEDFELAKKEGIPVFHVLDEYGKYTEGEWKHLDVWETNKTIAKTLHERGVVWKIEYIQHEYPHNLRNGNRLMYRAHPSWFMDIEGQRTEMLEQNTEHINWFPAHIKHGRFEKTVQQAPDWNLSRDRFWATAMPVWKGVDNEGKEHVKVVGSYAELKELSGIQLDDYHRPWIDDVAFTINDVEYHRIDKVLDCWFESGSMPFAQFHYPFENKQKFEQNFPGDFIVEYVGQVRAWFYYVHAVNIGLFGRNAFKNVITTGTLAGNDGRKMSKSFGNFTDPNELMDQYSADSLRFLLLSSSILSGEDFALIDKDVSDVARKLSMVWNMYDFFTLYADVDTWEWDGSFTDPTEQLKNPLDLWIVSRMHQLTAEVEKHMDDYDIPNATKPILPFIDDASNWYIRRSRRRFWKSGDDADKQAAYKTLHYVLVQLAHVMAPFTPFMAEELYQKLTGGESVHLRDWPKSSHTDELLLTAMANVRQAINDGLSKRAKAGIKVRQPLALATLVSTISSAAPDELNNELVEIVKEELNVKEVKVVTGSEVGGPANPAADLDLKLTPALHREGMMREVVRNVQTARKNAGLDVDDHILLSLSTTDENLRHAISEHSETIVAETLAQEVVPDQMLSYQVECKVDAVPLTISLQRTDA